MLKRKMKTREVIHKTQQKIVQQRDENKYKISYSLSI